MKRTAEPEMEPRTTLAEGVFEKIAEAIISGAMAPGSRISEPLMAKRYGISRGPLREALHRLQERRLITRQAHFGARVAEVSRTVLQQLFLVRESLEGIAAREAAVRATDEEIEEIQAVFARQLAQQKKLKAADGDAPEDREFHAAIARAAHNPILERMLASDIYDLTRFYRSQVRDLPGRRERALVEHQRIMETITERDPEMAEMQMRRHIVAAREGLEAALPIVLPSPAKTARTPR